MPRPRRTKVTTVPKAREPLKPVPAAANSKANAQNIYATSRPDGETLVSKKPGARRSVAQDGLSLTMAGGRGLGDVAKAPRTKRTTTKAASTRPMPKKARNSTQAGKSARQSTSISPQSSREASPIAKSTSQPPGSVVRNPRTNSVERVTDSFPSPVPAAVTRPPTVQKQVHATPSFLSMADFKRRPRQGSLLNMVRRTEYDTELEDDAVNDFDLSLPPLDLPGFPQMAASDKQTKSLPRKSPTSNGRKRKRDSEIPVVNTDSDVPSSSPQLPQPRTSHPPANQSTDRQSRPTRRRQTARVPAPSPAPIEATSPLSTPVTTDPVEPPKRARKAAPSKAPPTTTASLRGLLPARRRPRRGKRRDEFAILDSGSDEAEREPSPENDTEISDDESDSDELQHASRKNTGPRSYGRAARRVAKKKTASKAADGEHGVDDGDGELEAARRKFAEIDDYELDFESASIGAGGSSSPWR